MKAIKLNQEQFSRSLKARNMQHLWLYSTTDTTQRTHNNSIYMTKTIGTPKCCVVVEYDAYLSDEDIRKVFGKDAFIDGAVSPYDKENVRFESFYLKLS